MNSVHIPSNKVKEILNTCSDLCFDFAEPGEFSWTGSGMEFNPHLPQRRVEAGPMGPFVTPNHDAEVDWKFFALHSKMESSGKIEVVHQLRSKENCPEESPVEQRR